MGTAVPVPIMADGADLRPGRAAGALGLRRRVFVRLLPVYLLFGQLDEPAQLMRGIAAQMGLYSSPAIDTMRPGAASRLTLRLQRHKLAVEQTSAVT